MKLYLMLKSNLEIIKLSEKADGFVLEQIDYGDDLDFQLSVEAIDNKWYLKSNKTLSVINNNIEVEKLELVEYQQYFVKLKQLDKIIVLFCQPNKDINVYDLQTESLDKITIGSDKENMIVYQNPLTQPQHLTILKQNEEWLILAGNQNARVYVNNELITKKQLIIGDRIFINGLKIIWMGSFFRINKPTQLVSIKNMKLYDSSNFDNSNYLQEDQSYPIELYQENDYFYHSLRVNNKLTASKVVIDGPPQSQIREEVPFILTIGTMLTMGASSIMTAFNVGLAIESGSKTWLTALPQIIMCLAMIIGSLILPRLLKRYQKKQAIKREELRQRKYTAYLDKKQKEILDILRTQEQILKDNNPGVIECHEVVSTNEKINNIIFWSRSNTDDDFLTLRLGFGNLPSLLEVEAPDEHFTLDEDNLLNNVYNVVNSSKTLHNVPITLTLTNNPKIGVVSNCSYTDLYIDGLILQLITMQSPIDLKIVVLTSEERSKRWDYIKYLSHSWNDEKSFRFFATTTEEIEEVSTYLEQEYKKRKDSHGIKQDDTLKVNPDQQEEKKESMYKKITPYYVVIDDNYKVTKNYSITDILLKTVSNFGFSYIGIGSKLKDLPSSCPLFIELREKNGLISENNVNVGDIKKFSNEYYPNLDMRKIAKKISNIPVATKEGIAILPTSLSFLEMLDVSKIEQLNVLNRWKTNNPVNSLSTTIGVHANGDPFKLDLHEKFHGPHGLIAGMTGSGKSEFILTYILSLIINYHPYEVQFVLIDYKGGGLAGAFENKETGVKIPHLIGTITNLDKSEINRTLVSIESELKRRQRVFNEVRDQLGEGTIDIYKYQRLYREGVVKEPMAHLFIISDEFAELKAQQPEFMQQLISTSRIGRSLGIHLILATQKPSGVVNDQIWSNSKFKVCLKVQDRSDSMEMLKKPDAASIKETGRFYLQVGFDDYFDIGQSGWSGAKYIPSDTVIRKVDDAINFVSPTGNIYKTIKAIPKNEETAVNMGDQLTNIVKYIYDISVKENLKTKQLWLNALPEIISAIKLKEKYNYKEIPYVINPIIGEYDNPKQQEQNLLTLNLTNKGNTAIIGQPGSGKENLLNTIILSTILNHTPEEVNFYLLDFGSEALKMFNNIPHVGDIATLEDPDKVIDTFEFLQKEMDKRRELFVDYSGSYNEYIKNSGKLLPLIVVVLNNYDIFTENFSRFSENIQSIYRDGSKYGIIFIVTAIATNAIRSKMLQSFNNKLILQIPDSMQYRNLVSAPKDLEPAKFFGRGITEIDDEAYEFQTAIYTESSNMTKLARELSTKMKEAYQIRAKKIPTIPNLVTLPILNKNDLTLSNIPLGYSLKTKEEYYYNFNQNKFYPILTDGMTEESISFVYSLIEMFKTLKDTRIEIIDFVEGYEKEIDNTNINYVKDNFDNAIINLYNSLVRNDYSEQRLIMFFGFGQLMKKVSEKTITLVEQIFANENLLKNHKLFFIDTYSSYRALETEEWYIKNMDKSNGIWLGPGVGVQLSINTQSLKPEAKQTVFPYVAHVCENSKWELIKHMVEESDNNEE